MPRLYSSREIVKALHKLGFVFVSQKGSHGKFRNGTLTTIVPMAKKEIPIGTFRSILRQAEVTQAQFDRSL